MLFMFQLLKVRTHHQFIRYVYFIRHKIIKFPPLQDSSNLLEADRKELILNKQAYGSAKRKLGDESQIISNKRILSKNLMYNTTLTDNAEKHDLEVKTKVKQPPHSNPESTHRDSQRRCRIFVDDITKYKEGARRAHIQSNKSSKLLSSCQKHVVVTMQGISEKCDIRTDEEEKMDLDKNERESVDDSYKIVGYIKNLNNKGKLF